MDKEIKRVLTEGLLSGYVGTSEKKTQGRGNFVVNSRNLEVSGATYHDEWVARTRTGGGQELVKVLLLGEIENVEATRVYAGGVEKKEALDRLGITGKDVTEYLKIKLKELGARTRLTYNCEPEPDGDWQYSYKVLKGEIPTVVADNILIMGLETIVFKEQLVFAHGFVLVPVE